MPTSLFAACLSFHSFKYIVHDQASRDRTAPHMLSTSGRPGQDLFREEAEQLR